LSIATFRYLPGDLDIEENDREQYLERLNRELLTRLQNGGDAYLSNAIINGKFALRACIVNFRTSLADVEALLPIIVRIGNDLDSELRPQAPAGQAKS
jgi:glutamate/tyrosine decarboxylase-like PLP-dependent enzyme